MKRIAMKGAENVGEIFFCDICGNEVIVTKVGGGALYCCEQPMKLTGVDGDEDEDGEAEETEEKEEGEE